jgi:ferredoxin/flavodoxin
MNNAFIAYCSPAGSTRHVAQVIANTCKEKAIPVHQLDLGISRTPSAFIDSLTAAGPDACLFVGSPVYRDTAIPPVMAFLDALPALDGYPAVPFVTWGGANSGIALWQMGQVLVSKGCLLAGAAKVLGQHSMMWKSGQPVGQGHPDADDDLRVSDLVEKVVARSGQAGGQHLPLDTLDYQEEAVSAGIKKRLGQPWAITPKSVDAETCTQCAICKQVCPVGAVVLDPLPVFGNHCFSCFNCVRECPEDAIVPGVPLEKIEAMIRERVEKFDERPPTQIF